MSRRSIVETSEGGRTEIDYSSLTGAEIDRRIHAHEARYGSTLRDYSLSFSCDAASPHELNDIMDWERLVEERDERAHKYRENTRSR
jgi:RNase P/RNase MRP subunit p30